MLEVQDLWQRPYISYRSMPATHRMPRNAPKGITSRPHHFAGRGCAVSMPCSAKRLVTGHRAIANAFQSGAEGRRVQARPIVRHSRAALTLLARLETNLNTVKCPGQHQGSKCTHAFAGSADVAVYDAEGARARGAFCPTVAAESRSCGRPRRVNAANIRSIHR